MTRGAQVGPVGIATLIALLAQPSMTLADAVGTGDPTVVAGPDLLGQLIGYAMGIGVLGVAIAIIIGLGRVVSRIGGPPAGPADPLPAERPATRPGFGALLARALLVAAAVGGFLAGRATADLSSQGGLSGVFGVVYLVVFGGALVIGLLIIGLVATKLRHGHVSRATMTVFFSAALIVAGALGGEATASATGGLYREPVVLRAPAQLHVVLDDPSVVFLARSGGQAECRSVADSRSVSDLSGLDLGELGPGTLRVGFTLGAGGPASAAVEFFIDGGDLPDGSPMISWAGTAEATPASSDLSSGQLTFDGLTLSTEPGKPASESVPSSPVTAWPSALSGTLTWTCGPWSGQ